MISDLGFRIGDCRPSVEAPTNDEQPATVNREPTSDYRLMTSPYWPFGDEEALKQGVGG